MNQKIYDYLKANKDKFDIELLKKELLKKGFEEEEIIEVENILINKHEEIPIFPSPYDEKYQTDNKPSIETENFTPEPTNNNTQPQIKNKKATVSLILGIIAFFIGWIPLLGWTISILAIVFGVKGLNKRKKNPSLDGKSKSIAGIILGSWSIIASIIFLIIYLLPIILMGSIIMTGMSEIEDVNNSYSAIDNQTNNLQLEESMCNLKCEEKNETSYSYNINDSNIYCYCSIGQEIREYMLTTEEIEKYNN